MIAAILILAIAITGTLIGTLARYVTSGEVGDDADAAKFGLNIPTTIDLFSDSYTNVKADVDGKKIIAPGTTGQYKFEVTGTSEVAYRVSANISVEYSEAWSEYAPLEFSLNGNDWFKLEPFKLLLSSALESEVMAPNTPYASTQTFYWKWPFHVSDENDIRDTEMGAIAATGVAPSVTVTIEVIAAQVD